MGLTRADQRYPDYFEAGLRGPHLEDSVYVRPDDRPKGSWRLERRVPMRRCQ